MKVKRTVEQEQRNELAGQALIKDFEYSEKTMYSF